jgi:hypothetical protein
VVVVVSDKSVCVCTGLTGLVQGCRIIGVRVYCFWRRRQRDVERVQACCGQAVASGGGRCVDL